MGNSFAAVAAAWRTLRSLLIFSSHAFFSRVNRFYNPSRIRAGESGWRMVISNISEPPWLPNTLMSGRSLSCPHGRRSSTGCLAAYLRSACKSRTCASCLRILWVLLSQCKRWSPYISIIATHCEGLHFAPAWKEELDNSTSSRWWIEERW